MGLLTEGRLAQPSPGDCEMEHLEPSRRALRMEIQRLMHRVNAPGLQPASSIDLFNGELRLSWYLGGALWRDHVRARDFGFGSVLE
jgi:hypothetical protein